MKTTTVALISFVGASTFVAAGPLALIGTAVSAGTKIAGAIKKKGKRDLEFENALLVIRDKSVGTWTSMAYRPEEISAELMAELNKQGFFPPEKVTATPPPATGGAGGELDKPLDRALVIQSLKRGERPHAKIIHAMKAAGWKVPAAGIKRRYAMDDYEAEIFARDLYDTIDLYTRDAEPEAEAWGEDSDAFYYGDY